MIIVNREGQIVVPVPSLVMLVGPSGSGKSSFAHAHFGPYEVISSDHCRAMIADSETDQSVTPAAFELLRCIAEKRLTAGRLTVVDATNLHAQARRRNMELAQRCSALAVAIVFDVPTEVCLDWNSRRVGRIVDTRVVLEQRRHLIDAMTALDSEGFTAVYRLNAAVINSVSVMRRNLSGKQTLP